MEAKRNLENTYRKERSRLVGWLESRTGSEAEDILHEIVARAMANLDSLEPVRDLGAWLWRSARNAAIDAWRKRARRKAAGETEIEDFEEAVDRAWERTADEVEREELLGALRSAIDELPEEQRSVVEAQCFGGESFASISKRTGVAPDTIAARKRYAVKKLRAALADYV